MQIKITMSFRIANDHHRTIQILAEPICGEVQNNNSNL